MTKAERGAVITYQADTWTDGQTIGRDKTGNYAWPRPEDYAIWLLNEFLPADIDRLRASQQAALALDLKAFIRAEIIEGPWLGWNPASDAPPIHVVKALQADMRRGIERMRKGEAYASYEIRVHGLMLSGRDLVPVTRAGSYRSLFHAAVTDTLIRFWAQVEWCPRCGRPFFKVHKRVFCSDKCARQAHWENFIRRKGQRSDRERDHHKEYISRMKKKAPGARPQKRGRRKATKRPK